MNKVENVLRYFFRWICIIFATHTLLGLWPTYFGIYQDLLPPNFSWDMNLMGFSLIAFPAIVLLEFLYYRSKGFKMFPIIVDAIFIGLWMIVFLAIMVTGSFLYGPWSI